MRYEPGSEDNDFVPISEILRDDAQTYLFFLTASGVEFIEPVNDDLFAAHEAVSGVHLAGKPNSTVYHFDGVVHPLGCVSQEQYCLNRTYCSPLTYYLSALDSIWNSSGPGIKQTSFQTWANTVATLGMRTDNIIEHLGASALLAGNSFIGGVQGPLAPNQWQMEVQHWQSITLALKQRTLIEYAKGPSDTTVDEYLIRPSGSAERHICSNQVSQDHP